MDAMSTNVPLIEVRGLTKYFGHAHAVDGLDFSLSRGETVGLLGESGSGKTTTGRLLLRLTEPSTGEIRFDGSDIAGFRGDALRSFRTRAQLVFQNPFDALDPRFTVRQSLAEPLRNARLPRRDHEAKMRHALDRVHLPGSAATLEKYPHQMSGGQLQRVVLARALILDPDFIVADEPVSMLDVSVRAGILNVLREVRDLLGLTAIYISHDVALVRYVCARTMVMYRGKIVEDGPTAEMVRAPRHPYTVALIGAVPVPRVEQNRAPIPLRRLTGERHDLTIGCRFRDRCPRAHDRCATHEPVLRAVARGHRVACHLDL